MENVKALVMSFALIIGMFSTIALLAVAVAEITSSKRKETRNVRNQRNFFNWEEEGWFRA